jgi:hypothetical protein
MGVRLPFAVGAKAARPGTQDHLPARRRLLRPERDGARHRSAPQLPLLCIVSLNGGWTADPEGNKPGRYLGYTRYDIMAVPSADRFDTSRRCSGAPADLILLLFSAGERPGDRPKKMPTSSQICPRPLAGVMRLRRGGAVLRLRWVRS